MSIEEIKLVGTVDRSDAGEELRVSVKDAGNGPAIDARIYATEAAGTRHVKRGGRWVEVPAYCGPTKAGLWLTVDQAKRLAVLLAGSVDIAERYAAGLGDPVDWACSCGAENQGTARRCFKCDGVRRRDFLAVES